MRHHAVILAAALAALSACHEDESVGDVPGVLFGVAASTNTTNEAIQESAFTSVELKSERKFDLDRIYRQWDNVLPGTRELWTIEQGRTPIVSFKKCSGAMIRHRPASTSAWVVHVSVTRTRPSPAERSHVSMVSAPSPPSQLSMPALPPRKSLPFPPTSTSSPSTP